MGTSSTYDEAVILRQVADGDEAAFKKLYRQYGKLLYPFLLRSVKKHEHAEELIQETMLRVWLNRTTLPTLDNARNWIFRIASNLAITAIRKQLAEGRAVAKLADKTIHAGNMQQEMNFREMKKALQQAVQLLPPKRQQIYRLSREQGLKPAEIAEQLNLSESTVKNVLSTALKSIREHLQSQGYMLSLVYLVLFRL